MDAEARSGGASVQRGRSPRWEPASRYRSVRARPWWDWGRVDGASTGRPWADAASGRTVL